MSDDFASSDRSSTITWPRTFAKGSGDVNQTNIGAVDSDQWLRRFSLQLSGGSGDAIEIAPVQDVGVKQSVALRVNFQVRKHTNQSPNLFQCRIYNLAPQTMMRILQQQKVTLSAGYQSGHYGKIFEGTVVQYKRGKETAVDTYLEVMAGDGDTALGWDTIHRSWDKGTTPNQKVKDAVEGLNGITAGTIDLGPYGQQASLRASGHSGMIRDFLRGHSLAGNADQFIDNGKMNILNRGKYVQGSAYVESPATGLVGMPEVTPEGINATCLLNPDLVLGGLVKIDTGILSGVPFEPGSKTGQPVSPQERPFGVAFPVATFGQQLSSAFTSPTGTYKIILLEHNGDTRGNPWYSSMVCVALDASGNVIPSANLPYDRSPVLGSAIAGGGNAAGAGG